MCLLIQERGKFDLGTTLKLQVTPYTSAALLKPLVLICIFFVFVLI